MIVAAASAVKDIEVAIQSPHMSQIQYVGSTLEIDSINIQLKI